MMSTKRNLSHDEAISILADRGDKVAERLGVEEGPEWRDVVGTGHLIMRGAFDSLRRIATGAHSFRDAASAMAVADFAVKSEKGFVIDNTSKIGGLALGILEAEMSKLPLQEAVSKKEIDFLANALQEFQNQVTGMSASEDAHLSLKAYSETLDVVSTYYQSLANDWKSDLESTARPIVIKKPDGPTGPKITSS